MEVRSNTRPHARASDKLEDDKNKDDPTRVLLIEDNPGDARLIREMLVEAGGASFQLECEETLSEGLERLRRGGFDILILDLGLPDSQGLDTLEVAKGEADPVPIIVLTGLSDEAVAIDAVGRGAQDYLVKVQFSSELLVRSVRYAIERKRAEKLIEKHLTMLKDSLAREEHLSRTDPLTGLYNRRYFYELSSAEIARSRRYGHPIALAYMDADNFKEVNDTLGHQAGDDALRMIADELKESTRSSDLVARLGGDEFAVLLPESGPADAATAVAKLHDTVNAACSRRGWPVTLSIGLACFNTPPGSLDEMISEADRLMYSVKEHGKNRIAEKSVDDEATQTTTGTEV